MLELVSTRTDSSLPFTSRHRSEVTNGDYQSSYHGLPQYICMSSRIWFCLFDEPFIYSLCSSVFVALTTAYLLGTVSPSPSGTIPPQISAWATFLGLSSAILATIQYAPQLLHTYRMKLVGALSIPMMMIQTPGGILMVTSIVLRPGTNWTSELHLSYTYRS